MGQKLKCKSCGTVIESKHVHDFVWCKCQSIFIDGGNDYTRFGGDDNLILVEKDGKWVPIEIESPPTSEAFVEEEPLYGLYNKDGSPVKLPTSSSKYLIGKLRSSVVAFINAENDRKGEPKISIDHIHVKNVRTGATVEIDPHYWKHFSEGTPRSTSVVRENEDGGKEVLEDKGSQTRNSNKRGNGVRSNKKGKQRKVTRKTTDNKRSSKDRKKSGKSKRDNKGRTSKKSSKVSVAEKD